MICLSRKTLDGMKHKILVELTDFQINFSDNQAEAGVVWLVQSVQAQTSNLYYTIEIFWSVAYKS